jgi:ABC-type transport system substrate-binding protein
MKHFALALLVASSLLCCGAARAASRPHYGGQLRIATSAAAASLDPVDLNQSGSLAGRNLSHLIFDTLVTLDDRGRPQPGLAASWQSESGDQRWQFKLRRNITFQDGTPCTADRVAASLRVANPSWRVVATEGSVVIERDSSSPNLPAELALGRNGIAKRDGSTPVGTGPFAVTAWTPGKRLALSAYNDYWRGRAFADAIEIVMGQPNREQMIALDLGKVDLIEVAPEQARRAAADGRHVESSAPAELMALVFARDPQSPAEEHAREALALSIDRSSLNNVLLQGGGEPAGALLPNWMTGYAFLFPTNADLAKARQLRGEDRQAFSWTMTYDANDPVARVVGERAALNAHDAGLALQVTNSGSADARLIRVPIVSLDSRIALTALAASLGLAPPTFSGDSAEDLYAAESKLLQSQRVIPLLHLRESSGIGTTVRNWGAAPDGEWRLDEIWLAAEKP